MRFSGKTRSDFKNIVYAFFFVVSIFTCRNLQAQYPNKYIQFREIPAQNMYWQKASRLYLQEDIDSALFWADMAYTQLEKEDSYSSCLFVSSFKARLLGESKRPGEALKVLQESRRRVQYKVDSSNIEWVESLFLEGRIHALVKDLNQANNLFLRTAGILERSGEYPSVLSYTYFSIANIQAHLLNSNKAENYIVKALEAVKDVRTPYAQAMYYYVQAERVSKVQLHLKTEFFLKAVEQLEKANCTSDYLYFYSLLKLSAQYTNYERDHAKAQKYGKMAEEIALETQLSKAKIYRLYLALGDTERAFKKYDKALYYFKKARDITEEAFGEKSYEYLLCNMYLGRLYRYMKDYEQAEKSFLCSYKIGKAGWKKKFPNEFTLYGEFARMYALWNKPEESLRYAHMRLQYQSKDDSVGLHAIPELKSRKKLLRFYNSLLVKVESYRQIYMKSNDTKYLKYGLNHCEKAMEILKELNAQAVLEKSGIKNSHRTKAVASYAIYFAYEMSQKDDFEQGVQSMLTFMDYSFSNYFKYQVSTRAQLRKDKKEFLQDRLRIIENKLSTSSEIKEREIWEDSLLHYKSFLVNELFDNNKRVIKNGSKFNLETFQKHLSEGEACLAYQFLNFRDNTEKLTSARYDKNQFLLAVYIDNEVVKLNLIKEGEELKKELKILRKSVKTNDLALLEKSTEYVSSCLIYPFSSELETKSKLRIVVGEKLTQLPVEVLYLNREKTRQLVEMNTSYHFSLFDIGNKQIVDYRNSRILALAPQFDGDKGLLSQRSYWCDTDSATYRESIFRSPGILSMLPNAQDEVKEINLRYQTKVEKLTVFTNEVTKACFMSSLKNYDIVHIATHGYVDKKDYRNSGLFFSQNNGDDFLHLNEIYNLEIDANLIVLSACKTNVGQSQTGEGLMALPRGFIYAGVPNVIASLWKVHDERTKDLMLAFYKYLLEDKQTYAGALRKAKLDCIEKGFLPMDWAGFVLIGQ